MRKVILGILSSLELLGSSLTQNYTARWQINIIQCFTFSWGLVWDCSTKLIGLPSSIQVVFWPSHLVYKSRPGSEDSAFHRGLWDAREAAVDPDRLFAWNLSSWFTLLPEHELESLWGDCHSLNHWEPQVVNGDGGASLRSSRANPFLDRAEWEPWHCVNYLGLQLISSTPQLEPGYPYDHLSPPTPCLPWSCWQ